MDIDHIGWMIKESLFVCEKESVDESLLLPLVILHDVGYVEVSKGDPFNLGRRKAHMKAGKKITERILEKVDYPEDKAEKIAYIMCLYMIIGPWGTMKYI